MKRVRWDGELQWDDGEGTPLRSDTSGVFYTDYAGSEWAEIEEAVYDSVPRQIFLKVKPVEKQLSLVEEVKRHLGTLLQVYRAEPEKLPHLKGVVDAIDREESTPAKPPRYTDEAVDEFLEAVSVRNKNGSVFHLSWLEESKDDLIENGSERLWDAFRVLKKQGEAAR